MLLLITGSGDGTSDVICKKLKDRVFRLNYDIFNEYALEFTPDYWRIENPAGHVITSEIVSSCFWWKAFNFPIENQDKYVVEEVKYIFRELNAWCRLKGIVKGNPFDFHNYLGKTNLTKIASNFFHIPQTLITFKCAGLDYFKNKSIVAKSLTSTLTNDMGTLLTTEVDKNRLHPSFPWFLQEKIVSEFDVTVFICGDKLFGYRRSRESLKGLDWRAEQNFADDVREWHRFDLTNTQRQKIKYFCKEIEVDWGRIDFMTSGEHLIFLEFNANGQWMFLDYDGADNLLPTVVNYLLPN